MKMYCQDPSCDFECEDDQVPAIKGCPKCGCMTFAAIKVVATAITQKESMMTAAATGLINRTRENTIRENEVLRRGGLKDA
jgi:predicted  nucleic acid-binding Zn-ribbon protein